MFAALKKYSFTQQAESAKADHVFLVRATDTSGRKAWYYVLADRGKCDAFKKRDGAKSLNISDYGTILHSGFGEEPPHSITAQLRNEYGFSA